MRISSLITLGATWMVAVSAATAPAAEPIKSPLAPPESLRHFQLEAGLTIELVACEPEVVDPIAMRFDEDGRLWVVEMRDYPHGPPDDRPPLSQIRVLSDRDQDGRYETSRTFADGLLFPTGLQPWRGGVFVTLAGAVEYLADRDGDGRADARETWFRGFAQENPQLRANHPRLGLDGRIYVANGLRGGAIEDARPGRAPGAQPLSISSRDFAFDPRGDRFDAVSGNGQFGLAFDDFGNRFVCNNREPLVHVVFENRYTARNPLLAVAAVTHAVAASGEKSHVYPRTAAWTTSNLHAGQFTAACGVTIYRGHALGPEYRGNAFVCEPTGNLVHREIVAPHGATFASRPAREGQEFLASDDPWFRPVNLEVGPDGALYVVDMYRAVIEHPQFMPEELQQRPDLRAGDDRGRIYRIARSDNKQLHATPKLSAATGAELVSALAHENAWWRETAARLLWERGDASIQPTLESLAASNQAPAARVPALWLLANLNCLSIDVLQARLADSEPRVREAAIALCEGRIAGEPELRANLIRTATDADAAVRYRAALVLGGLTGDDVIAPLVSIALSQPPDPWVQLAVAAALPCHASPILARLLTAPEMKRLPTDAPQLQLVREVASIVGADRDSRDLAQLLAIIAHESDTATRTARESALLGLAQGLARRGESIPRTLSGLDGGAQLTQQLAAFWARVALEAGDESLGELARAAKIALLAHDASDRSMGVLLALVERPASQSLRIAAADALARQTSPEIGPRLMAIFATQTPALRRAILDVLLANSERTRLLLTELEKGQITRADLDSARIARLKTHPDQALREQAARLLADAPPADRQRVLAEYQAALALPPDARAGRELFRTHCATCHRVAGIGVDVAPDISDSRVKTPQQLLVDILNPNQAIDNNYISYTVALVDGVVHTGIIGTETAASITLRQPENKRLELLRTEIEAIRSSGVSFMPEGFERQLSRQQMADLISFLKNWRYADASGGSTVSEAR
ncbi:MAG: PVC-type heme-binding CxxCH protein [Pirellulales bacterium]